MLVSVKLIVAITSRSYCGERERIIYIERGNGPLGSGQGKGSTRFGVCREMRREGRDISEKAEVISSQTRTTATSKVGGQEGEQCLGRFHKGTIFVL